VLLTSALANAQCTKDTDCKGDRVCDAGKCTSPAAALPPAPAAPPGSEAPAGAPSPAAADAGAPPADGQPSAPPSPSAPPAAVELQLEPAPNTAAPLAATAPLEADAPTTHRRSRNAMIMGIVMVSVGPIALLGALAAKNGQERCDTALERDYPDHRLPPSERYRVDDCNSYSVPLYVFGIGGALLTVGGIPLIVYGAKNVGNTAPKASLHVLPWVGPESSGLRLRLEL
jgi:hypothetical protein